MLNRTENIAFEPGLVWGGLTAVYEQVTMGSSHCVFKDFHEHLLPTWHHPLTYNLCNRIVQWVIKDDQVVTGFLIGCPLLSRREQILYYANYT